MKTALFILTLLTSLLGCKDSPPPDCGCESKAHTTIPESANSVGKMFYNRPQNLSENYYNNTFWIVYPPDASSVHSKMIVCNEDILGNEFVDIMESGESVEVKFSGHRKEVCEKAFAPSIYTYERITLTSIERQ